MKAINGNNQWRNQKEALNGNVSMAANQWRNGEIGSALAAMKAKKCGL
jgi:hypothetical protein